ncbi:HNH endonuclease [Kosakonia sacchari]|uniref:HNH endonuclease n=1 Tax=Kosakonia sacchari TaxID=1158459 RepID=UPI0020C7ADA4|nr:HNH endonuclease [Kosakonia sacchari]
MDDYDPATNTRTMQLVEQDIHRGISHKYGVSQYRLATSIAYTHPARFRGKKSCP